MGFRTRQAVGGFLTDLGGQAILTISQFLATPLILGLTSQSLYGFWLAALATLTYLGLLDLSVTTSVTRSIARSMGEAGTFGLNSIVSTALLVYVGFGLVWLGIGLGIAPYVPQWLNVPPEEVREVASAYRIAIVASALGAPLSIFSAVLVGLQRMSIDNLIRTSVSLGGLVLSIVLLYLGFGLKALACASLLSVVTTAAINYFYVRRYLPGLAIRLSLVNGRDLHSLCSFGGYFQLAKIANTVALGADSIVIAAKLGAAAVVPYAMTSKLATLLSVNIASKLPLAVFPAMSNMFGRGELVKLRRTYLTLAFYASRLAVLAGTFVAVVNHEFVSLWVGEKYYGGFWLTTVFVYSVLLDTVYRGTTAIVHASGDLRDWSLASVAEACVNLTTALILVAPLGVLGVALGNVISKTLTTGVYTPFWVCRKLNLSFVSFLRRGVLLPSLRSLVGSAVVILVSFQFPMEWGWTWVIALGFISIAANVVCFEGLRLLGSSTMPWRVRLREIFLLESVD